MFIGSGFTLGDETALASMFDSNAHTVCLNKSTLRVGMIGLGMIFDETYRPVFEQLQQDGLFRRDFGFVDVQLTAVASRTGRRAEKLRASSTLNTFQSYSGAGAHRQLVDSGVDAVCVATPDDRHFEAAYQALAAGKHVLIEKPSVLRLQELDELVRIAEERQVLAKVVYHKLADPDHKRLRTLVRDGVLKHVNHGYCSLLEPKSISGQQFAEWIQGRNPATYVAVHYLKLIDFTFGPTWRLARVTATGQRGIVGPTDGTTWDSVQLQVTYVHPDGRDATFDIHTSWVTPDNFPGYVEQEVQFRFDNAVWNAHQRKRGVEVTIEGRTPLEMKITPNHHYNSMTEEPWGGRRQRGYGLEVIQRFFEEVSFVEFGGPPTDRPRRYRWMSDLEYNALKSDRRVVAIVQALETILRRAAEGKPDGMAFFDQPQGGVVIRWPGQTGEELLYDGPVN